jgi:hypothetical protein
MLTCAGWRQPTALHIHLIAWRAEAGARAGAQRLGACAEGELGAPTAGERSALVAALAAEGAQLLRLAELASFVRSTTRAAAAVEAAAARARGCAGRDEVPAARAALEAARATLDETAARAPRASEVSAPCPLPPVNCDQRELSPATKEN